VGHDALRIELPRLRLSFTAQHQRLYCDQHRGFWLADGEDIAMAKGGEAVVDGLDALLAQWGGGAVLLQNQSRELMVLVSALAEPIRPAAGPSADGFLPSAGLVLRRDNQAWVENLAEGSRHYYYPIHPSEAFAFAPTQAANLYLLLCRLLTWHFAEATAAALTVSEISSNEERQLWERLCLIASAVHHPDAAASCLRLSLATSPYCMSATGHYTITRWDTSQLLLEYVRKRHLASANCRLTPEEELQLLTGGNEGRWQKPELLMRKQMLQAVLSALSPQQKLELPLRGKGHVVEDDNFDRVCDKTFTEEVGFFERISSTLRDVTYNRPEKTDLKGLEAMIFIDGLFSIFGPSASAAFPFLYELFTETMSVKVLSLDDPATVASTLLRVCGGAGGKSAGLSVLRMLELNPQVCSEMPRWGASEHSWSFGLPGFKVDTQCTSKLLEAASRKLNSQRSLTWPDPTPFVPPEVPKVVSVSVDVVKGWYWWAPPVTQDVDCQRRFREGTQRSWNDLATKPLQRLAANYVQQESGKAGLGQGALAVRKALQNLRQSRKASAGRATLDRLLGELDVAAKEPRQSYSLGGSPKLLQKAQQLSQDLEMQRQEDVQRMRKSISSAMKMANEDGAVDWLRRACGIAPRLGLCSLVTALMAHHQSPSLTKLRAVLPASLGEKDMAKLWELVASVLLYTVRVGQVARVQRSLEQLFEENGKANSDMAVSLQARAVAVQLGEERHLISGRDMSYDPRLLVFEFLCNIMLRKSQVQLLQAFMASAQAGTSVCQQMLMGEGKTTVIAPVLVLLLADANRLVCACMPSALLDMSRAVLAERFSSPVLPRPVLTLEFHRQVQASHALLQKLEAAQRGKAPVIAAPTSVKSILLRRVELLLELYQQQKVRRSQSEEQKGSWLRFPSWLSNASDDEGATSHKSAVTEKPLQEGQVEEVRVCGAILGLFHKGVMLLDEVDLLLDPLKSELNWPLGRRFPLDMTGQQNATHRLGFRYTLPFQLLDAIFAAVAGSETMPGRREAQAALQALAEKIQHGRKELKVQVTPHFVLLSRDFYMKEMLPHLADWAALCVDEHLEGILVPNDLRGVLRGDLRFDQRIDTLLCSANRHALRALNLTLTWLHQLLPYILSKVHRVSYGLLTGRNLDLQRDGQSRKLLAVPFVGKDTPSTSSEFSHPDVAIGFTILSYRLHGLRERDVPTLLNVLLDEMRSESTLSFHRRTACQAYVSMVVRAGGRVRGFTEDGRWIGDAKERANGKSFRQRSSTAGLEGSDREASRESFGRKLWPLELLDLSDPEQLSVVSEVLRFSPLAIRHLLEHHVFTSGTLDRNEMQLNASGQELAGKQLFGRCLGFSGTPNDLLPKSLGRCIYAVGDDGQVLQALSSVETVTTVELGSWSPSSILELVATTRYMNRPRYHALIDSGALVTGMSNLEVAQYLLKTGLHGLDGVLFLNERNERVVLERDTLKIVELAQCGLSPEQRFTFYDHVHTTGMDIKQPLLCTAALTLSKDMTLRDYAQGAYRMRGIGHGQRIEVLLTPEVRSLMNKSLSSAEHISEEARASHVSSLKRKPEVWTQMMLVDLLSWLVLGGIRSEARKRHLLHQQDLQNLWRSGACRVLESERVEELLLEGRTKVALFELLSSLDFRVSEKRPGEGQESIAMRWRRAVARHVGKGTIGQSVWQSEVARDEARSEAEGILQMLEDSKEDDDFNFSKEQVQEQEQEQEEEVEQDHEQEVHLEEDLEKAPEAASEQRYARDAEEAMPWPLRSLSARSRDTLPFYPMADFAVNKGIFNESSPILSGLPPFVLISDNYYKRQWRLSSVRRLRNVICFMEWVPSVKQLRRFSVLNTTEDQRSRLREALTLCAGRSDCSSGFDRDEVRALCSVLDLAQEGDLLAAEMSSNRISLVDLEKELITQSIYKMQQGRYFVALSLEEAEHMRGALHLMQNRGGNLLPADCGLALRCIACKESVSDDSLLDWHGPVLQSTENIHQLEAAEQIFRFLNNAEDFQAPEVSVLLRCLQLTRMENRLPWWLDVRACRRRSHRPWQKCPVAKVFQKNDEFEDWGTKALLLRFRWTLAAAQLWPADAFRLFDVGGNGCLQRKDLLSGLERLGVRSENLTHERWVRQVDNLFRWMVQDEREVIFLDEFRNALDLRQAVPAQNASPATDLRQEDPPERAAKTDPGSLDGVTLDVGANTSPLRAGATGSASPPTQAVFCPENAMDTFLMSPIQGVAEACPRHLTMNMCQKLSAGRFKVKFHKHTSFRPVWSDGSLSIWAASELIPRGSFIGLKRGSNAVKERVVWSHYVSTSKPTVHLVEVTDEQHSGFFAKHPRDELNRFLGTFFPHPTGFRQIWRSKDKSNTLYIWVPLPPSNDYVAGGMVCTTVDEAPEPQELRCMPRFWAQPGPSEFLYKAWSSTGPEGLEASMWLRGDTGVLQLSTSEEPPMIYEMPMSQDKKFYVSLPQTE